MKAIFEVVLGYLSSTTECLVENPQLAVSWPFLSILA